jgi:16S rRNA (cytosine1402-N4)-methyltransferase
MIAAPVEHIPVLADEAIELLNVRPGGTYVDCTVGLGGHSERILLEMRGRGRLIALDRDKEAMAMTGDKLSGYLHLLDLHHDNFKNLPLVLRNLGIDSIDGCIVDLGVSSHQLSSFERGFSFREDGPLDMRMDSEQRLKAEDLVNRLSEQELSDIFRDYGEERYAKKIAHAIVGSRKEGEFRSTLELARLVEAVKGRRGGSRIHPATQVFQALRIQVNQELEGLDTFLSQTIAHLKAGGRLVVISFHSLEDRIVKKTFQLQAGKCICFRPRELCSCPRIHKVEILTRKPVIPSEEELAKNPRARSAKLRAVERINELTTSDLELRNGGPESPEN